MHNNAYKQPELPECFERNAEGMLKNMAIHELALLATYYGVTVDNIESVVPDAEYSRCLTLTGPSGEEFTDFAKVGFTITTKEGKTVTVKADRCGSTEGGDSKAVVSIDGVEKFQSTTPDEELKKVGDMHTPRACTRTCATSCVASHARMCTHTRASSCAWHVHPHA